MNKVGKLALPTHNCPGRRGLNGGNAQRGNLLNHIQFIGSAVKTRKLVRAGDALGDFGNILGNSGPRNTQLYVSLEVPCSFLFSNVQSAISGKLNYKIIWTGIRPQTKCDSILVCVFWCGDEMTVGLLRMLQLPPNTKHCLFQTAHCWGQILFAAQAETEPGLVFACL
jgi:hypothetical protein